MLPFKGYPSLRTYLKAVRDVVFQQTGGAASQPRLTLVMGNPSADLDSFISAVVFSYFHNNASKAGENIYIPLLNMPKTASTELWRLRPEFGVALRQATTPSSSTHSPEQALSQAKDLLSQTLTIKDLLDSPSTLPSLKQVFHPDLTVTSKSQPIILVDHNALAISIPHTATTSVTSQLLITGCIDHHIDEHTTPSSASPRLITTGIGSCTTLVLSHLRKSGIYPNTSTLPATEVAAIHELLTLALAPILIDTAALKATGEKCSDLDRTIVEVIELEMGGSVSMSGVKGSWDRDGFYEPIKEAKKASLDNLSGREMLERDYKEWVEEGVGVGIASLVKDVEWVCGRTGGAHGLVKEMGAFVEGVRQEGEGAGLGVLVLLTPGGKKGKEVLMVEVGEESKGVVKEFERRGGEELGLGEWDAEGKDRVYRALTEGFGEGRAKVWWMTKREKTRKQGAPIVRDAVVAVRKAQLTSS